MVLRLHNTLSNRAEDFVPRQAGKVSMYHCGPTVYSSPHIGNFRAFLLGDLLRRFFEDQGFVVHQVMNITDVGHMTDDDEDAGEDKLEKEARKLKLDPWAIARQYEEEFRECLDALHFRIPHELPRATDHIVEMGAIIGDLLEKGIAYQVNGNVYFEIDKFAEYGKLSNKVLDDLAEGARVEVNPEKKDPRDFALWKIDPHHLMQWDAPFAGGERGFPGWHIECSAMAMKYLGPSFDLHSGGEDNIFPHHECEIAQSEAHTGEAFVGTWVHCRHLMVDGKKMSKSQGNFFTVKDVLGRGFSGVELRYALIRSHYRQSLNFTLEGLEEARHAIGRVQQARKRLVMIREGEQASGSEDLAGPVAGAQEEFIAAIGDDLNTSEALAAVFGLVSSANRASPSRDGAAQALETFARIEEVLGCFGPEPAIGAIPEEMVALLEQREKARGAKDWGEADRLRDLIAERGFKIVDTAQGPRLERG